MWMEDVFDEYYDDFREQVEIIIEGQPNFEDSITLEYLIGQEEIVARYQKGKGDRKEYVNKNDVKLNAYDDTVEIFVNTNDRVYHQSLDVPPEADIRTIKSKYNNGILEITFSKKGCAKAKRVRIK